MFFFLQIGHCLQTSEATCLMYTLRYHIIIFDRFCWSFRELCLPWHSVHYSLSPVRKCNNVRDLNDLPGFWPPNSPDINAVNYKIWASSLPEKRRMWMTLGGIWLMCELEWNRALLTIPSISGADVSSPTFEATRGHFGYSPWQITQNILTVTN